MFLHVIGVTVTDGTPEEPSSDLWIALDEADVIDAAMRSLIVIAYK